MGSPDENEGGTCVADDNGNEQNTCRTPEEDPDQIQPPPAPLPKPPEPEPAPIARDSPNAQVVPQVLVSFDGPARGGEAFRLETWMFAKGPLDPGEDPRVPRRFNKFEATVRHTGSEAKEDPAGFGVLAFGDAVDGRRFTLFHLRAGGIEQVVFEQVARDELFSEFTHDIEHATYVPEPEQIPVTTDQDLLGYRDDGSTY